MEYNAFMGFDPAQYGPDVARILALDGNGDRLTPLTCGACAHPEARRVLNSLKPAALFPNVKEPAAAMAGLWLYFSCYEEAHKLADASKTPEGALWHGILHRQEPDYGNAAYWFGRAGPHETFPDTARAASGILNQIPDAEFRVGRWDPYSFIAFCERAAAQPGTSQERAAREIQRAEWQILFDYCARPPGAKASE
jgi:hypothetical protein